MALNGMYIVQTMDGGSKVIWFHASQDLLVQSYTPSELIIQMFGNLTNTADSRNQRQASAAAVDAFLLQTTFDDAMSGLEDDALHAYSMAEKKTTTSAYMVSAFINNLPPVYNDATATDGPIQGFLDYTKRWGFSYDVDVLWNRNDGGTGTEVASAVKTVAADLGASAGSFTAQQAQADEVLARDADAWTWVMGGDQSVWPLDADANWVFKADADDADAAAGQWSTTYGLEAIGYDFYNTVTSAGWSTDSNESLYNNEMFRVVHTSQADQLWANDPAISIYPGSSFAAAVLEDDFRIKYSRASEVKQVFASKFHCLYNGSLWTNGEEDNGGQSFATAGPWFTNNYEKEQMRKNIDLACASIGPQQTLTEFPKRMLNHIQRRKKNTKQLGVCIRICAWRNIQRSSSRCLRVGLNRYRRLQPSDW